MLSQTKFAPPWLYRHLIGLHVFFWTFLDIFECSESVVNSDLSREDLHAAHTVVKQGSGQPYYPKISEGLSTTGGVSLISLISI